MTEGNPGTRHRLRGSAAGGVKRTRESSVGGWTIDLIRDASGTARWPKPVGRDDGKLSRSSTVISPMREDRQPRLPSPRTCSASSLGSETPGVGSVLSTATGLDRRIGVVEDTRKVAEPPSSRGLTPCGARAAYEGGRSTGQDFRIPRRNSRTPHGSPPVRAHARRLTIDLGADLFSRPKQ